MKIFHKENGREIVYVQMQDMMYLNSTDLPIPASIFMKVFSGVTIVDNSNRFEFVSFSEEHEVKYFRELEFILDYNQYKDMDDNQLNEEAKKFVLRANEIVDKWNVMTLGERKKNQEMLLEHENLGYMLFFLSLIHDVKHGKRSMPFPSFVK